MHVLFIHQNFPAQFGHVAGYLAQRKGFRCSFLSQKPPQQICGIEMLQYKVNGGPTESSHFCSRAFDNAIWHSYGILESLDARPDVRPDLIVAHSGFFTTVFLRELFDCPIVSYFEYYYGITGTDMDFRPDFPYPAVNRIRALARNATILLDLANCDVGYSPTRWQRNLVPRSFQSKIRTIFDGIDTSIWKPYIGVTRRVGDHVIPEGTRIVTYVSRGFESIRGFDIFMKVAKLICQRRQDVVFMVVGEDRVCYGTDLEFTGTKSFKQWTLDRDNYDLSRFIFTGEMEIGALAKLLTLSDLHIYLTVPYILSWSLLNALACGATVLASNTAPVREVVEHDKNGLLVDFFDIGGMADRACEVLDAPQDYKHLGRAGIDMVSAFYSVQVCLPSMLALYEDAVHHRLNV